MDALSVPQEWENSFEIFQSPDEQQLLPEIANCLSIKALLAIHNLEDRYTLQVRPHAEHMAPKQGDLPFLRFRNTVIGGSDILQFLQEKEYTLNGDATPEEKITSLGVMSLINSKLVPLELLVTWADEKNASITYEKYGYNQPEPLKKILHFQKRQEVSRFLRATGWLDKSNDELKKEAKDVFDFLSKRLDGSKYLTGESLTDADVFVYGHLQALFECELKNNVLLQVLEGYSRLQKFCLNFTQLHLGQQAMIFSL